MTTTLPTVTARGVQATTRALTIVVGVLLVPLLAQHLFGRRAEPAAYGLFAVTAAVMGAALSRASLREGASSLGTLLRATLGGVVAGMAVGVAWVSMFRSGASDGYTLGALFGAIYGAPVGLGMGALLAGWSRLARRDLERPAAVTSLRHAMRAGALLTLASAAAFATWKLDAMRVASLAAGVVGIGVVAGSVFRAVQLARLLGEFRKGDGSYQVIARAPGSQAPAFAWVAPLDHVVVRASAASQVEPAPFRTGNPSAEVAAVPGDLTLVEKALGGAVALGFALLGLSTLGYGAVVAFSACCGAASGCGGCAH